eukprot:7169715-Prymnesium_polylepis.3
MGGCASELLAPPRGIHFTMHAAHGPSCENTKSCAVSGDGSSEVSFRSGSPNETRARNAALTRTSLFGGAGRTAPRRRALWVYRAVFPRQLGLGIEKLENASIPCSGMNTSAPSGLNGSTRT